MTQNGDTKMYVLDNLLNGCPNAKILEVILENYSEELTIEEIAEMSDLSKEQTRTYLRHLGKMGIMDYHEKAGKGDFWFFNKNHDISKALILLEHTIVTLGLKKAIEAKE